MYKLNYKYCILLALLYSFPVFLQSQSYNPAIKNYPPASYLLENYTTSPQNWSVVQDYRGVIYVANTTVLLEFDGINWRAVEGTENKQIISLATDKEGRVYGGGIEDLGYLHADSTGKIRFISLLPHLDDNLSDFGIINYTLFSKDAIFFVSEDYILRWNGKQFKGWKSATTFGKAFSVDDQLIVQEKNTGLLSLINEDLKPIPHGEKFKNILVRSIIPSGPIKAEDYMIVTKQDGIFNSGGDLIKKINTLVIDGLLLKNGNIALATYGNGIIIIDKKGKIQNVFDSRSGLFINECLAVFEDNSNHLWVGLNKGLSTITYDSPLTLFDRSNNLNGIVNCFAQIGDDILVGTSTGLYKLTEVGNLAAKPTFYKIPGLNAAVWDILPFRDQVLLASESGIFKYADKKLQKISPGAIAYKLHLSTKFPDVVLIGLYDGLGAIQHDSSGWNWLGKINDIKHEVRTIAELKEGIIWASYSEASSIKFPKKFTIAPEVEHFSEAHGFNEQRNLFDAVTLNNEIYFGTYSGIYTFNKNKRQLTADPIFSTFLDNNTSDALSLKVGPKKDLWLTSKSKAVKFEKTVRGYEKVWQPFAGIPKTDIWEINPLKDGTVWLCTSDGLYRYKGGAAIEYTKPFNTLIREISINGDSIIYHGSIYGKNINKISLPHKMNDLVFKYAATSFDNPEKLQYCYKLDGFDQEWSDWVIENKKEYTGLWEGNYTFRVQAKNMYGTIGKEAVYQFSVLPPAYRSWWAYGLYAIFIVGAVGSFIRYRTRKQRRALKRKKQELEKEKILNEKLLKADKLKDEFLANTSHELRTPLTGIIGLAEALYDGVAGEVNEQMRYNLTMIISAGERLSSLVNSILDFSKLKTHELKLNLKPVDLRSITEIVIKISMPLLNAKSLQIIDEIAFDTPLVSADENRLQQIMHNLIGNAIKFTVNGTITISSHKVNDFIEVSIADTGIGIAPEKHKIIFESFEQIESENTREFTGTGLGLAITKQLVELHGGKIWVESAPGQGTTFYFTMPIAEVREKIKQNDEPIDRELEKLEITPAGLKTKANGTPGEFRILVVDDEPINQQVLANHLSFDNYEVVPAMSGEEALNFIEKGEKFDLILLDIMMPKISGYEVCRKIREKYLPNELPIVMITAKNQVSDLVEGFSYGANDYLTKPFSKNEFLARVKTHLNLFKINSCYGRFVPHEFLRKLGRDSILDIKLGDQVQGEITILFSDIRSYTTLSETMTPKENFDFLNSYLSKVGPGIRENNGFVNQYYGDGVMALFLKKPEDGINAAIKMLREIATYNQIRHCKGRKQIIIGVGIHSGPLMLGIIGDADRMAASVVSDSVNTASRMEGLTKYYGASIIISENTFKKLNQPEEYRYRLLGKVQVKGKIKAASIYEIFDGDAPEIVELKSRTKADFEEGLKYYFSRKFTISAICFERVLDSNPADKSAKLYFEHAAKFMAEGVPEAWTGIETMESK